MLLEKCSIPMEAILAVCLSSQTVTFFELKD